MSKAEEQHIASLERRLFGAEDYKAVLETKLAAAQERIAELEKGHREYCMGLAEINVSLEAENQRLREALEETLALIRHKDMCNIVRFSDASAACTCGAYHAVDVAKDALGRSATEE